MVRVCGTTSWINLTLPCESVVAASINSFSKDATSAVTSSVLFRGSKGKKEQFRNATSQCCWYSSRGSCSRYFPFRALRRISSNTAEWLTIRFGSKACINSVSVLTSLVNPAPAPNIVKYVRMAAGIYPLAANSPKDAAPCLLLSLDLSCPKIREQWA